MKNALYNANSLVGLVISIYANLDFGKPIRLRSKSPTEFMGRFYHLTHIGLVLSAATFIIGLVHRRRKGRSLDASFESVIARIYIDILAITVTAECFIPLVFWVLWKIDKGSVVTTSSYVGEDAISMFFNLCMHGFPTIFLLVEFFFSEFLADNSHYILLFFVFTAYLGIMLLFNRQTGRWPYRIIEFMTGRYRLVFFAGCFALLCTLYFILSYIHSFMWRNTIRLRRRERRKQKLHTN